MMPAGIKKRLLHLLHLEESPHELAKAFAVGVFVSFTPFLGLHTALALGLAWTFRLNKAVAVTGTFVNNPWTIALVYMGPTWAVVKVMRSMGMDVPRLSFGTLTTHFQQAREHYSLWQFMFWKSLAHGLKPYMHIRAFLLGTTLAGALAALISYFILYHMIKYYRAKRSRMRKMRREEG